MQAEEEEEEAIQEKRYNFPLLLGFFCLFLPEVVRTLAGQRSARQPGGARAASAAEQLEPPRRLLALL